MLAFKKHQDEVLCNGFTIVEDIYTSAEVNALIEIINTATVSNQSHGRTKDLFAIRRFLKEVPKIKPLVFNERLNALVKGLFDNEYFVVKSIYFDKPEQSNWFVPWHQDLTIAVNQKVDLPGYVQWTTKHGQFAVQPPLNLLQENFTIRIHLDDTNEHNGALKVIPESHLKLILRDKELYADEAAVICSVKRGGVMIMKPLLLHASSRTTNKKQRRVIHIEFSKAALPPGLNWAEKE